MTDTTDVAGRLLTARAEGDFSPAWLKGTIDLPQALDLQLAVLQAHLDRGATIGGWKVGLTSEASRTKLGADERPFGFVLAERTLASGTTLEASTVRSLSIEAEMCFTIGEDITDPTVTPDRILASISEVTAGFELNEARPGSAAPDFFTMVTDCLTNWGIVCGPGVSPVDAESLSATEVTMHRNGEQMFQGISREHLDDHTISLCRLAEQLGRHGQMLRAGQKVITGAFARFPAAAGETWRASFSNIGDVDIQIT